MKLYTITEFKQIENVLMINEAIDEDKIRQMISDAIKYGLSLKIDVSVLNAEEIGSILKLAGEDFVISF
jgi:hypothetical protein